MTKQEYIDKFISLDTVFELAAKHNDEKAMRKYKVITLTPEFRVESLIEGENSLERATCLVEKNKKTLLGYGIPCSVFIRRVKRRKYAE